MTEREVAAAMERVASVLRRRPDRAMRDGAPATACWQGATHVVARHGNGTAITTEMAAELGGRDGAVTPGWLFRAGIASCAATSIAMTAAARGIALDALEVEARNRADTRGLLGMADADGRPFPSAPEDVQLHVRIAAGGTSAEQLRALVEDGCRCAPIAAAVRQATPLALHIDVEAR